MTVHDEALELAKVLERDDCIAIARVLRKLAAELESALAEGQRLIDQRKEATECGPNQTLKDS